MTVCVCVVEIGSMRVHRALVFWSQFEFSLRDAHTLYKFEFVGRARSQYQNAFFTRSYDIFLGWPKNGRTVITSDQPTISILFSINTAVSK